MAEEKYIDEEAQRLLRCLEDKAERFPHGFLRAYKELNRFLLLAEEAGADIRQYKEEKERISKSFVKILINGIAKVR